jgi:hypothetical protein
VETGTWLSVFGEAVEEWFALSEIAVYLPSWRMGNLFVVGLSWAVLC